MGFKPLTAQSVSSFCLSKSFLMHLCVCKIEEKQNSVG